MKVVIIGSGNVATVLGKKVLEAGNSIEQVVARNKQNAVTLAALLESNVSFSPKEMSPNADLYIIAVSDSALHETAAQIRLENQIVVHTTAAVSKDVLSQCSKNYGVLYPLQTLRKELKVIPPIPVLIDGNTIETQELLKQFADDWAESVEVADDLQRLKLHVAAVFASNFTNYLFSVTEQFCKDEGLDFSVLYPLIAETFGRIKENNPAAVQTGPAVRHDYRTIALHEQLLSAHPSFRELYAFISASIVNFYKTD